MKSKYPMVVNFNAQNMIRMYGIKVINHALLYICVYKSCLT